MYVPPTLHKPLSTDDTATLGSYLFGLQHFEIFMYIYVNMLQLCM